MLTAQQKKQLESALNEEKDRLLKNAKDGLRFSMERERTVGRDSIDESMEEELFSTELRLRDREKYMLTKINDALERLAKGTIDVCEDCEEPISFKRLLARPTTTLCIDCKEEREQKEISRAQQYGKSTPISSEDESSQDEE